MKQVWILNHYAQEPGGPGGTRHYSLAKYLPRYGWQAHIIAASVELNTGRQRLGPREMRRLEKFGEVPFLWLKTPTYTENNVKRLLNIFCYTAQALLPHTRQLPSPHVVIGSSVHPFAAWAGALLAKRHRTPFLFEVRDLWPQTLVDVGNLSKDSRLFRLLHWLEKWLYQRADRIITLLPRAVDYIAPLGISPEKIIYLPNGTDLADFPASPPSTAHQVFELMYFGAHGNANGLDVLLRAMDQLRRRSLPQPVRLRLVGDGPFKPRLMEQARELALDNVSFEPPVTKSRIPTLAAEADGFVFNLVDAPVFQYGISSNKLFDFMAAARPLLFCSNASNNPVKEANAGITVPPENPLALADAIEQLLNLRLVQRREMGENARLYIENNHDCAGLAKRLALVLDEVCSLSDPHHPVLKEQVSDMAKNDDNLHTL